MSKPYQVQLLGGPLDGKSVVVQGGCTTFMAPILDSSQPWRLPETVTMEVDSATGRITPARDPAPIPMKKAIYRQTSPGRFGYQGTEP